MRKIYKFSLIFFLLALWGLAAHPVLAQENAVTGKVTDEGGEALPGANILLQGSTIGTVTDVDGNYRITVQGDNPVLVFSSVGYQTQTIEVAGRSVIDIAMEVDLTQLGEVVVTAFGLEREKKALTYSTQTVNTEELAEARPLNVIDGLSGKVAGISISRSGSGLGAPSRVILRGNRSIAGDSQPLYIVDGVPILGDITDINPNDIASISVLKGPNAAALYGNRASNGAIIITTKSGTAGKGFNVSLNTTYMAQSPIILTNYQNEYGQGSTGTYSPASESSWGPRLDGSSVAHWSPDPNWPVEQYAFTAQPNNVEDFFQTGHNLATSVAISAGNENTQTYFSYTYTDAAGVVPNNELQRHNVHLRVTNKLTDKLTLDAKLNYIREEIDNSLAQGENFTNPSRHVYRLPRNIRTEDAEVFEYTNAVGRIRQNYWNPGSNGGANPYWAINRNLRKNIDDRIISFASLKYDITDEFSVQVRSAIDRSFGDGETKLYNDTYIVADAGQYLLSRNEGLEWNTDFLISYEKTLGEDWFFNINFGGNARKERNSTLNGQTETRGAGLTVPNFFALGNTQKVEASENVGSPKDVNSLYGFAQIAYKNSIFLDITGRNDWSSTLPSENWSFFYPSFGLNVVLSDLIPAFPSFITFAKVRGSWAEVGNDTAPYQLDRTASVVAGGRNGYLQLSSTIPNESLLPEETQSLELGADVRFLDNRIGLDFTWYKTNTQNQLFTVALPVGSGASSFFTNGGDVENRGIEAILTLTPVRTPNFNWDINFNFASNESEVVQINDERPKITVAQDFLREFAIEEGKPWGEVYSRGFARDEQGRVIIGPDGVPRISDGLTVKVANYNPDWLGGLRNTLTYRNFNLSFLIDIRQGGSVTSLTNAIIYADGVTEETLEGREGGLIFGENFFAGETAVLEDGSPNDIPITAEAFWVRMGGRNAPVGEVFSYDASNIRLRELVLGYSLPASLLSNTPISNVKISLVGRNLFFFSNAAGNLDPEVIVGTSKQAEGFESFAPPTSRELGFNVKIDF